MDAEEARRRSRVQRDRYTYEVVTADRRMQEEAFLERAQNPFSTPPT